MEKRLSTLEEEVQDIRENMIKAEVERKLGRRWQYAIFGLGIVSLLINNWEQIWIL